MTGNDGQLRVAFIGKGGAGKSVLAGMVCRHRAGQGHHVLALDLDTVPGLAWSLGVDRAAASRLPSGLADLIGDDGGRHWEVLRGGGPARLADRYAAVGPDQIRFLTLGKLPDGVEPSVTVAFRYLIERYRRRGWDLIADLAAGTRQPMFGWARFARARIIVTDTSEKSFLTARRLAPVATHLVVNRGTSREEAEAVAARIGLPLLAVIPYDETIAEAERRGVSPIDYTSDAPAVQAAAELAEKLEALT